MYEKIKPQEKILFENLYQYLVGIAGFLLLYAGIFVYPDERENLHNITEDLWLRWSEKSEIYEGNFLSLGKAVANRFIAFFNKFFGYIRISQEEKFKQIFEIYNS